jgi:alpha/beta superfamily hydrolase
MKSFVSIFLCLLFFNNTTQASPFIDTSFIETSITLETATGNLFGTLTTPINFVKGPIVIIIAGSGPTDRNGNNPMMKNNCLLQLAHAIADSGIASLRFDKRGIGASSGSMKNESNLRFDDYVNDVINWIKLLKKNPTYTSVIIAGHSEGSLIGMIAAKENANKYISISGAGKPASDLIKDQLSTQPSQIKEMAFPIIDSLTAGHMISNVNPILFSLFRPSVQPYMISWFKYNPQNEIVKLKMPVMIIQGDNDIQVSVDDANKLKTAKKDAVLSIVKSMNHILKNVSEDRNENIKSYSNPNLPISQELINTLINFIKE